MVLIRDEVAGDRPSVEEVHRRAFGEHGGAVVDLLGDLADLPDARSIVAVDDDTVVGHVLFSGALLDAPHALVPVAVLSPLAVLPEAQRRGIGAALVRAGLLRSEGARVPLVFLEGDPRYYSRLGFREGAPLGFRRPSLRIPEQAFQVLPLPAYEPRMTGTLVYPSAFWDHDAVGLR